MADEYDSDFSDGSAPNEEDQKMQQLLAEWDEKDEANDNVYVDSDEEDDDDTDFEKKAALKKKDDSDDEDDDDEDDDEEYELDEVTVDEEIEEEVVEEEDEPLEEELVEMGGDDMTYMTADTDGASKDAPVIVDELKKKPKKKKEKKVRKKVTDPDDDDDEEDAAMKELLANWDAENGGGDDDDDDDDSDDDDSEVSEREVVLDDNVIDHVVLAAPDLEEAMGEFEKKTGLAAVIAGTIKGLGIKCARVSFTDSSYLEIVAPDPKGPGPIGELIKSKGIKELTPFHFAIRTRRAEALKDEVTKFGYTPDHITMFGAKSDGTPRKWEMLYLYGHKIGGTCPFFINWANSDHPCATLPVVGKLKKLTIRAPEDDPVHQLLDHVGVSGLNVEVGDKPKLAVSFSSPEGTVKFSTHKAVGFKFPGFEADVGAIPGDDGSQDAEVVFDDPKLPELLPVNDEEDVTLPESAFDDEE